MKNLIRTKPREVMQVISHRINLMRVKTKVRMKEMREEMKVDHFCTNIRIRQLL